MNAIAIDIHHLRHALADGLERLSGTRWTPADDGSVRSDGSLAVFTADLHGDDNPDPRHIDIGFAYDPDYPDAPVLWDCTVGVGNTSAEAAEHAAYLWLQTTAPTLLEVLERHGRLADHYGPDNVGGLPGKHVVQGPALIFGSGDATELQEWIAEHCVLPELRETVLPNLTAEVNGVKLLFGGTSGHEVAEVRVNSAYDAASSDLLAALPWPRLEAPSFVRQYLLVMPLID